MERTFYSPDYGTKTYCNVLIQLILLTLITHKIICRLRVLYDNLLRILFKPYKLNQSIRLTLLVFYFLQLYQQLRISRLRVCNNIDLTNEWNVVPLSRSRIVLAVIYTRGRVRTGRDAFTDWQVDSRTPAGSYQHPHYQCT